MNGLKALLFSLSPFSRLGRKFPGESHISSMGLAKEFVSSTRHNPQRADSVLFQILARHNVIPDDFHLRYANENLLFPVEYHMKAGTYANDLFPISRRSRRPRHGFHSFPGHFAPPKDGLGSEHGRAFQWSTEATSRAVQSRSINQRTMLRATSGLGY